MWGLLPRLGFQGPRNRCPCCARLRVKCRRVTHRNKRELPSPPPPKHVVCLHFPTGQGDPGLGGPPMSCRAPVMPTSGPQWCHPHGVPTTGTSQFSQKTRVPPAPVPLHARLHHPGLVCTRPPPLGSCSLSIPFTLQARQAGALSRHRPRSGPDTRCCDLGVNVCPVTVPARSGNSSLHPSGPASLGISLRAPEPSGLLTWGGRPVTLGEPRPQGQVWSQSQRPQQRQRGWRTCRAAGPDPQGQRGP